MAEGMFRHARTQSVSGLGLVEHTIPVQESFAKVEDLKFFLRKRTILLLISSWRAGRCLRFYVVFKIERQPQLFGKLNSILVDRVGRRVSPETCNVRTDINFIPLIQAGLANEVREGIPKHFETTLPQR